MSPYKIYEKVLVDGKEATIRDIYTRAYRDEGNEIKIYLSYRIHEKEWWGEDVHPSRVQKLKGEMNFV